MAGLGASTGKAQRILTLVAALQVHPRTLEQLREDVGLYTQGDPNAGRKQLIRDKAELDEVGVTIRCDDDVYRLVSASEVRFTQDELRALDDLAGIVADPETGSVLAAFASGADAYPDLRASARVLANVPEPLLANSQELHHGITQRRVVAFTYRGANREAGERRVEPWGLRQRRGLWYLLGHCLERDDHRFFRLDRIVGAVARTDDAATREVPTPLPANLLPGDRGPVAVRLARRGRFDARRLGASLVPDDPDDVDGGATARFPEVRDESVIGFALRFDGLVLDPPGLDEERRLRADRVHDLHTLAAGEPPAALHEAPHSRPVLDPPRLRRLLVMPAWLRRRPDVLLSEAARGLGCTVAELRADVELLGGIELPGLGSVYDLEVTEGSDADACIVGISALHPTVQLSAMDRSRLRTLLATGRELLAPPDVQVGIAHLDGRLDDASAAVVDQDVDPALLRALRDAVDARCVVTFRHRARGHDHDVGRRLTPTALVHAEGQTYVEGWDHDREAPRQFRLDRLTDLALGEVDPVRRDVDLPPPTYTPAGEEVDIVLRSTHVGSWVLARLPPARRLDLDDGTVWALVRTDVPQLVLDHVMVAGGEVEVIAPPNLREDVAQRAAEVR